MKTSAKHFGLAVGA